MSFLRLAGFLAVVTAALLGSALLTPRAQAQSQLEPQPAPKPAPVTKVSIRVTDTSARAAQSLEGPRAEMVLGSVLLTAAPALFTFATLALSGGSDASAGAAVLVFGGYMTGIAAAGLGGFLLGHGIRRSKRIHRARQQIAVFPQLQLGQAFQHGSVSLRATF
ncbi:MAG: hypothetical protein QM778_24230 [Myxococcales bacterium]